MRTALAGAGALEALSGRGEGRVLVCFPKACYLAFSRGLVALVGPRVHPGPLHVILDAPPPRLVTGSAARMAGGWLLVGDLAVPVAGSPVWRGRLPSPERFRKVAGLVAEVAAEAAAGSLLPTEGGMRDRSLDRLKAGDLEGLAALLGGLGPGLTPAGDDVLLGVLLALRAAWGRRAERRLLSVAESVSTGFVSRAFLAWGARGQALAPIHDLVEAAAAGDRAAGVCGATALAGVGESSGADTALGLSWGAEMVEGERLLFAGLPSL
jgi:hypothetical protein